MLSYAHGHSTRSQAIASAGTANPTVVINKYDPGRSRRANKNPICTHFTKLHRSIYPSSFFCTNCKWWEHEVDLCNKRVNQKSKTYTCKAKHYSWLVPHPLWTVSSNHMLTKEEAESIILLGVSKIQQQEDKECVTMDEESIRTVDEDDVEDNGSVLEDGEMIKEIAHDAKKDIVHDGLSYLSDGGGGLDKDNVNDDDSGTDMDILPPQRKKQGLSCHMKMI